MRMNLDRAWLIHGHIYGPGDVDVPEKVGAALQRRGAVSTPDAPADPPPTPGEYTLSFPDLSPEVHEGLLAAGFRSNEDVYAADDTELTAVRGLGQGSLKRIRARQSEEGYVEDES